MNDLNNLPKFVCLPGMRSNNHTGHIIHVIQKRYSTKSNFTLNNVNSCEIIYRIDPKFGQNIKTWENTVDLD